MKLQGRIQQHYVNSMKMICVEIALSRAFITPILVTNGDDDKPDTL